MDGRDRILTKRARKVSGRPGQLPARVYPTPIRATMVHSERGTHRCDNVKGGIHLLLRTWHRFHRCPDGEGLT